MKLNFNKYKELLFNFLFEEDFEDNFLDLISQLSNKGYSKTAIYKLFIEFHKEIQSDSRTKDNELYYNRLSDFMDGFTAWGKGKKILPEEPDI